ncbi:TfoX/Sxy family protein [Streptomyces flavalbus]|uniref:TfoX/Sxy family protein n=1 Tax=Streptomyces flavalbus TaxID=2665155 RepID=A0ABW2WA00_9ACTN
MAFDEGLAERVRTRLAGDPGITEKRMFGGLAFLYEGNLAVCVTGDELLVRVGPTATETALSHPGTRLFDMTGRPMRGWIVVSAPALSEDEALTAWINQGHTFASTLPPK